MTEDGADHCWYGRLVPVEPARRKRPYLTCTVSPAAIAAAKELAARNGISTSAQVELLIRQAARKEGLDLKVLGRREERRRSRRAHSQRPRT